MYKYDPKVIQKGYKAPLNLGFVNKFLASYQKASEDQKSRGIHWYSKAQNDIKALAKKINLPYHNVAYAVAALSTQMKWEKNLQVVKALANGHDAIGMRGPVETAKKCLKGETKALSGPKVNAFALALIGKEDQCVIDRWIMRILLGRDSKKIAPTQKEYGKISKALEVAARMVSLPPNQFQATIWLQTREAK